MQVSKIHRTSNKHGTRCSHLGPSSPHQYQHYPQKSGKAYLHAFHFAPSALLLFQLFFSQLLNVSSAHCKREGNQMQQVLEFNFYRETVGRILPKPNCTNNPATSLTFSNNQNNS